MILKTMNVTIRKCTYHEHLTHDDVLCAYEITQNTCKVRHNKNKMSWNVDEWHEKINWVGVDPYWLYWIINYYN